MRPALSRPSARRRGLTLVEMLVVVALVVLMMLILVTIFAAATGAITVSRTLQEMDQSLRQLDGTIRRDLQGVTARLTPPLDPRDNLGYLEYGENWGADLQGEDTDDYLAFTAQAPEGQPFIGRVWVPDYSPVWNGGTATGISNGYQPILVQSDYAEIIYFLRNGNLYRRVLLVAPERRGSLTAGSVYAPYDTTGVSANQFPGGGMLPFLNKGWQGVNDISARPATINPLHTSVFPPPTANTLGDLTNRENRRFTPRFADDYYNVASGTAGPDGVPDDDNADGVPDFYPTLYPLVFNTGLTHEPNGLASNRSTIGSYDTLPFPYIFPGAYSYPPPVAASFPAQGVYHALDPTPSNPYIPNHAPLEFGDSLPPPTGRQNWWGFPTWKETLSTNWTDPVLPLNYPKGAVYQQSPGLSWVKPTLLTPLSLDWNRSVDPFTITDPTSPVYGSAVFATFPPLAANTVIWSEIWEDDLIMTGVRSFDVKAYEPVAKVYNASTNTIINVGSGYYDLGYANFPNGFPYYGPSSSNPWTTNIIANQFLSTFGHEGRIPPLPANPSNNTGDYRLDPQALQNGLTVDVGDSQAGVIRLLHVFDTWSTEYTQAPAVGLNPLFGPPFAPPIYPSYPPPYSAPLRGIQIQIRVVDPKSEHVKVLTIRQDFSDKL